MRKFYRKREVVEAAQFDGTWPSAQPWVTQYGATWMEPAVPGDPGTLRLQHPSQSSQFALKGDWIVLFPFGRLHIIQPVQFAALFEPIDPPGTPQGVPPEPKVI